MGALLRLMLGVGHPARVALAQRTGAAPVWRDSGRVTRSWGSTPRWRRVRRRVLERDGYVCQLRLPGRTGRADEVHHKFGRLRPGKPLGPDDHNPAILQAACRNCNRRVKVPADPPPQPRTVW
jgi:5-methylcytosine-specific restriction endonuclease McrA